jgi:DNA processing protein
MNTCSPDDILDWLALASLPRVGCSLIHRLVETFGTPTAVLAAGERIAEVHGAGAQMAALFTDTSLLEQARNQAVNEYKQATAQGVQLVPFADANYPRLLREISDPPPLLYVKGNVDCLQRTSVAIVGSRAASSYGKRISFSLAGELARAGIVVTSGLALGIDGNAHAGCLEGHGATIAVLGCGVDVIYPRSHVALYKKVEEYGALVSEYPMGTRPDGFRFPARNRIISGLSRGIIVVEATKKSGSLITARLALDQGRDVFAVPGRMDSVKSEGAHFLIQQGATLVQSADDVLQELELVTGHFQESVHPSPSGELSPLETKLLHCLDVYPIDIDFLQIKSKLASATLYDVLLQLELKGLVRQLPGQQYERIP